MQKEWKEMEKFIKDCIQSPQLYVKSGLIEPVHLLEVERKILIEGMQESLNKCILEIQKSHQLFEQKVGFESPVLK